MAINVAGEYIDVMARHIKVLREQFVDVTRMAITLGFESEVSDLLLQNIRECQRFTEELELVTMVAAPACGD